MHRRTVLAAFGTAGITAITGYGMTRSDTTLSDPTIHTKSSGRHTLNFTSNGEEVGSFSVLGHVESNQIHLQTEIWHRQGTNVKSIKLRVWMPSPQTDLGADVAVVSPVEGDSSPPPSVYLFSPRQGQGTVIEITDLDDLKDETISTLEFIVIPSSKTATTLFIDSMIELTSSEWLDGDYTLDGQLQLEFPDIRGD